MFMTSLVVYYLSQKVLYFISLKQLRHNSSSFVKISLGWSIVVFIKGSQVIIPPQKIKKKREKIVFLALKIVCLKFRGDKVQESGIFFACLRGSY